MIEIEDVTFWYRGSAAPALRDVSLRVDEGEMILLAGRTGSGKSTLLGTLNGLVPHFTGGHLEGSVRVAGRSTRDHSPRELADVIGVVGQDPLAGFVTDTVEEELAYGMEQLAVPTQVMRRRVEETLDLLGIAELRHRPLRQLSGGQQQRVAIGSVLTMHPRVLVLDEPTSALDPGAAEDVLATLARLVDDLGTTVVLAEHRMERVVPFADRMAFVHGDGTIEVDDVAALVERTPIAPPVVQLGRLAGWSPLPLTIREARRRRHELLDVIGARRPSEWRPDDAAATALAATDVLVRYGSTVAVRGVDLTLRQGSVTALMGRNGSGKSSLLWALQGTGIRQGGTVEVAGTDPKQVSRAAARSLVGLVPQTASDLLYLETVDEECASADHEVEAQEGTCRALLDRLAPGIDGGHHPRDLSEGQKLALVLAVQLSAAPEVMLLDEPTRGLDYAAKRAFAQMVEQLAAAGRAIVIATHDVEFVAEVAHEAIVMAEGEIVAQGLTREVLAGSPAFAPQVAKVLGEPWLTVAEVAEAVDR